jgi:hypothetical protein
MPGYVLINHGIDGKGEGEKSIKAEEYTRKAMPKNLNNA